MCLCCVPLLQELSRQTTSKEKTLVSSTFFNQINPLQKIDLCEHLYEKYSLWVLVERLTIGFRSSALRVLQTSFVVSPEFAAGNEHVLVRLHTVLVALTLTFTKRHHEGLLDCVVDEATTGDDGHKAEEGGDDAEELHGRL